MQPVTLYITVNITPPNPYNSPPRIPTENDNSFTAEATVPGLIRFPTPEHFLPLSHHQPVETGNITPQSLEEVSTTGTWGPRIRIALSRADGAVMRMAPLDRSNTWESDNNIYNLLQAVHGAFDFAHHEDTLKFIKPQSEEARILTLLLWDICTCCDFIQSYTKDSQFCTSSSSTPSAL